jgi:hypothetical protein
MGLGGAGCGIIAAALTQSWQPGRRSLRSAGPAWECVKSESPAGAGASGLVFGLSRGLAGFNTPTVTIMAALAWRGEPAQVNRVALTKPSLESAVDTHKTNTVPHC